MDEGFLNSLVVEAITDSLWRLVKPLNYKSSRIGLIEVPEGFVTDFASVPRVPIFFLIYGARAHHESTVHDYLYQTNMVTRKMADRIFLNAMIARGKPFYIRWPMYIGVRLGGLRAYKTGIQRYKLMNG